MSGRSRPPGLHSRGYAPTDYAFFRFACRGVTAYEVGGQVWAPRWAIAVFDAAGGNFAPEVLNSVEAMFDALTPLPVEVANRVDVEELRAIYALAGPSGVRALVAERNT